MRTHQQQPNTPQSQEAGYTILEAIVAMVVVSVLMIAIAPVIVFSTATRVQARRVELATQAARSYIDGVRIGSIPVATFTGATINPIIDTVVLASDADRSTFTVPAPTGGSLTCSTDGYCSSNAQLYCINYDSTPGCQTSSVRDMIVQAYRSIPDPDQEDPRNGYLLGVRVYRADSFGAGVGALQPGNPQSTVTSGLGNRNAPVVVMTTEIGPSTGGTNTPYQGLCTRLGGKGC